MAQGVVYQCSKVECEDHLAIQAPPPKKKDNRHYLVKSVGTAVVVAQLAEQ